METFSHADVVLGLVVMLVTMAWRFDRPITKRVAADDRWPTRIAAWLGLQSQRRVVLFPPVRANTTLFKFWLFRTLYGLTGAIFFLICISMPEVRAQVDAFIGLIVTRFDIGTGWQTTGAAPLLFAMLIALLLHVPPFCRFDSVLRRFFYRHAAIPAQQLRDRNRLKNAAFSPPECLKKKSVISLEGDGFAREKLIYQAEKPTTASLWTKLAVLVAAVEWWQGKECYQTAFSLLKNSKGDRSVETVRSDYQTLKPDARRFIESGEEDDQFRIDCKQLLDEIYDLLSRVLLYSHRSEYERAKAIKELGFDVTPSKEGPLPDADELVGLGLLILLTLGIPLYFALGLGKAVLITLIMYSVVLIPILVAHVCPRMSARSCKEKPRLAYPALSFLIAFLFGALLSIVGLPLVLGKGLDLIGGWEGYLNKGIYWSFLQGTIAVLIAWRSGVPGKGTGEGLEVEGWAGILKWGTLRDGFIFMGVAELVVLLIVMPALGMSLPAAIGLLLRVTFFSFLVGFFIPSWSRRSANRPVSERRGDRTSRQRFQRQLNETW